MSTPFISQYTERQNRSLKRVVESLTAAQTRTKSSYERLRSHSRMDFQDQILVCLTSSRDPEPGPNHPGVFPAWAYNLSQSGIGFVSLTPLTQDRVAIGVRTAEGSIRWLHGQVVRTRPIPEEDFIDYGVAFKSRKAATSSESAPPVHAAEV